MKRSTGWFTKNAAQDVFAKVPILPLVARSGNDVQPARTRDSKSAKYIVVGETVIGGKEVVGG